MNDTDQGFARRLARGEAAAVDAFYREHCDAIYRFAYFRVGRSDQDAEDVTADTFLTALRRIGEYGGRAPLGVWLRGIARNKCRERLKALARRSRLLGPPLVGDAAAAALADLEAGDLPSDVLSAKETASAVTAALSQLPAHYERVLRQKYVDELTFLEIGEATEVSAKAAESLVQRAKVAFSRVMRVLSMGEARRRGRQHE